MGAKNWEDQATDQATQLASEANRGRQTLKSQGTSLSLEDFKPNNDVTDVLTQYSVLLSRLSGLNADEFRASSAELNALHSKLCHLAESIQEQLFPRSRRRVGRRQQGGAESEAAGGAVNEDLPVTKGKEPAAVGDEKPAADREPEAVGDKGPEAVSDKDLKTAEHKARRILWYNWFFVACLITFIQTRLPFGLGVRSWRSAKAVLVANDVVNRDFPSYGTSAFYVLDTYSAIQYLLSGCTLLHLQKSRDIAARVVTSFAAEYHDFFPPGLELVYCPALLIASITNYACEDVCYAIGLKEVGARLRHVSLQWIRDHVGMCMAIEASLMEDVLFDSEPLRSSAYDPLSAIVLNRLPIMSFAVLDIARSRLPSAILKR